MKRTLSILLSAIICLTFLTFTGCGKKKTEEPKKKELNFERALDSITEDFTNWYVEQSEYFDEDSAKRFLDETVDISDDKKTMTFCLISGVSSANSDALNDFGTRMFNSSVERCLYLVELMNKELEIPDSITDQIKNTDGSGEKQGYHNDTFAVIWSLTEGQMFLIMYTIP